MKNKIGFSTYSKADLVIQINEIISTGADYIELDLGPHMIVSEIKIILKKYMSKIKFDVAHLPDIVSRPEYLSFLEDYFKLFDELDICRLLVIHYHSKEKISDQKKIDILKKIQSLAISFGLTLSIENTEEECDVLESIIEEVDSKFILDIGHANILGKSNQSEEFINKLGHRLVHVHVSDNLGGKGERDDLHLSVGLGSINFRQILGILKNYAGKFTLEIHSPGFENKLNAINNFKELLE
jgi:sugar phosphate isomerase/epimerase